MRPNPGPSLPRALLDELESADQKNNGRGPRRGPHQKLSRKEARKQEREGKKQRRAGHFTSAQVAGVKRPAGHDHAESPQRKKSKTSETPREQPKPQKVAPPAPPSREVKKKIKEEVPTKSKAKGLTKGPTALEKLAQRSGPGGRNDVSTTTGLPRTQKEKEEDAYIAYLESKLGVKKGTSRTSKLGAGMDEDGLDDLFQDINSLEASIFSSKPAATSLLEGDDSDNEESFGESDAIGDWEDEMNEVDEEDEEEEQEEQEVGGDESDGSEGSDEEEEEDEDTEWTGFGATVEEDVDGNEPSTAPGPNATTSPATRYVPPHLRNRTSDSEPVSEEQMKLTRQLKGLLNRLSEQNIGSILESTEEIYRNHRRHDVTSTLTTLIIDGISNHSILLDSYVVLHAAFVASLHKIIGVEFAAYFVQNVVVSYERHLKSLGEATNSLQPTQEETLGKECSNLLVLLSELFNCQVISHVLIYDVIRGLLEGELSEVKVELLLKIARDAVPQLRTVDPAALKDIIQIVHSKLPAQSNAMSSRSRFMVETLTNLKNNKLKKNTGSATTEAVERMKKFLSGLNKKRQVKTHEPLRVTLEDLHSAESKGKWWLVGAAWGGDPLADRQEAASTEKKVESTENVLLKLAKKQGMNTDIRRSIFVVLMSSEDYVDACERLSQLKLTEIQQREIIRVILHCCGNEKSFNPYYAFVIQQLCRGAHSYKVTLQFCLWDFLRDLGETDVGGTEMLKNLKDDAHVSFELDKISSARVRNVARAYAWWLAKDCCALSILKPVDFTVLKPPTQRFFKELFTHLLISTQLPTPLLTSDPSDFPKSRNRSPIEEVFIKATRLETLALGLVFFLEQVFTQDAEPEGDAGFLKWATKVAVKTLRTGVDVISGL